MVRYKSIKEGMPKEYSWVLRIYLIYCWVSGVLPAITFGIETFMKRDHWLSYNISLVWLTYYSLMTFYTHYINLVYSFWLTYKKQSQGVDVNKHYDIHHLINIVMYNEPESVLEKTLERFASLPNPGRFEIMISIEQTRKLEPVSMKLLNKFKGKFGSLQTTIHPKGLQGENPGSCSNKKWGSRTLGEYMIKKHGEEVIDKCIMTYCDIDTLYHPQYFEQINKEYNKDEASIWCPLMFYNDGLDKETAINWVSCMTRTLIISAEIHLNIQMASCWSCPLSVTKAINYGDAQFTADDLSFGLLANVATDGKAKFRLGMPIIGSPTSGDTAYEKFINWKRQTARWSAQSLDIIRLHWRHLHSWSPIKSYYYFAVSLICNREIQIMWALNVLYLTFMFPACFQEYRSAVGTVLGLPIYFDQLIALPNMLLPFAAIIVDYSSRLFFDVKDSINFFRDVYHMIMVFVVGGVHCTLVAYSTFELFWEGKLAKHVSAIVKEVPKSSETDDSPSSSVVKDNAEVSPWSTRLRPRNRKKNDFETKDAVQLKTQTSQKSKPQATHDMQLEAFPMTRIDWERARWYHLFWVLYIPVGSVLFMARVLLYAIQYFGIDVNEMVCKTLFVKKNYSHSHIDSKDLKKNCVIVGNHHSAIVEYLTCLDLFNCTFFTIADPKVGVFKNVNSKNEFVWKKRGEKLVDLYQRFRKTEDGPLLIYPQGATTANHVMSQFMTPIFDAMGDDEMIYCLANDFYCPLPIHLRYLGSSMMMDLAMVFFNPFLQIRLDFIGPVRRGDFKSAREAADYCQELIAKAANKKLLPVDVFHKFKLTEEFKDGHHMELKFLHKLQSNEALFKVLFYPFTVVHLLLKEPVLLLIGSILSAIQWNQEATLSTTRATGWTFMITCLIKLHYRAPRPLWVDTKIRLSKYVWQADYSFPSGHVSFVTALLTSLVLSNMDRGMTFTETMMLPQMIVLTAGVILTSISRMMLGMHFPTDIVYGLALGVLIPYVWIGMGYDSLFVEQSRLNPLAGLLFVLCVAIVSVMAFMYYYKQCNTKTHHESIVRWNHKNQEAFQLQSHHGPHGKKQKLKSIEPQKLHIVYLQFGILIGFLVVVPLQFLIGPEKFRPVLKTSIQYTISVGTMLGGMLVLGAMIAITGANRLVARSFLCTALVMWIGGYSQFATKLILGQ